jgi:hypothetical protein
MDMVDGLDESLNREGVSRGNWLTFPNQLWTSA